MPYGKKTIDVKKVVTKFLMVETLITYQAE